MRDGCRSSFLGDHRADQPSSHPGEGSVSDTQARNSGVCSYSFGAFLAAVVFDVVALVGVFVAAAFFWRLGGDAVGDLLLERGAYLEPDGPGGGSGAPVEGLRAVRAPRSRGSKVPKPGELNFVPGRDGAPHLGQGGTEGGLDLRARLAGCGGHGVDQLCTAHQFLHAVMGVLAVIVACRRTGRCPTCRSG